MISAAFTLQGTRVATGGADNTVRIWDAETGESVGEPLQGHEDWVRSVAFSPDGTRIVSGGDDNTVRIWDAETGESVGDRLQGHEDWVFSAAYSPDGTRIVSGGDNTVRVWDAETGEALGEPLRGHESRVVGVKFSPDGRSIVSHSTDGIVFIWNGEGAEPLGQQLTGNGTPIVAVAFSAGGGRIASLTATGDILLSDAVSGQTIDESVLARRSVLTTAQTVAFSLDQTRIITSTYGVAIRLWDFRRGNVSDQRLPDPSGIVGPVAISPDGTLVLSVQDFPTPDGSNILVWDVETEPVLPEPLANASDFILSIAFSPASDRIATGGSSGTIRVWDLRSRRLVTTSTAKHDDWVRNVAFTSDGTRIVSGGDDGIVRVWDAASGLPVGQPRVQHDGEILSIAVSRDGGRIVSGGTDRTVRLWDVQDDTVARELPEHHEAPVFSVTFSPDGERILSADSRGTLGLWDVATSQLLDERFVCPLTDARWLTSDTLVVDCPDRLIFLDPDLRNKAEMFSFSTGIVMAAPPYGVYASPLSLSSDILAFDSSHSYRLPDSMSADLMRGILFNRWTLGARLRNPHVIFGYWTYLVLVLLLWGILVPTTARLARSGRDAAVLS